MTYIVAVRALCEFTAKRGDLDLRFTPAPTALEGIAGHATVAARRASAYEAEITLTGTHRDLTVRGRADGYDAALNRLEEVKTYRGDLDAMPANHRALHWAQALVYGHLLCQTRALSQLNVALVYFDIGSQKETVLTQSHDAVWLESFFVEQCERFLDWAAQEAAHRNARNA
ncbi:MAG TPA: ATP-dependent DNA helicase, partial [Trinickia sp.]|nr:ATP-dependent DNA helicase [Trinickia sp.]